MRRLGMAAAAASVSVLITAGSAQAADTLDFWNGVSTSGQCGSATLLGSQKIDDPAVPGIQQAGTIQKYKRTCTYPTSASQTCWNTRATRIDSTKVVKAGITWVDGGAQYWLSDSGAGWVSSPVICEHMVDGTSWGAWAQIGGVNAVLYT